jgi:hypothetical protein
MRVSNGAIVRERVIAGIRVNTLARIAIEALLIIGFSALTALAKRAHPGLSIPSSSAPLWLSAINHWPCYGS